MYSAISESRYAKARNQFIYTVGLETSNLANVMMTEIATNGNFYKSTASNLSDIYNNIADSITAQLKEVVVTDQMGLGFTIYDEDLSKIVTAEGNASFNSANQTLTWNIGDKLKPHPTDAGYDYAKLTYRIQVTDEILELGLPLEGLFESNRETKMSYKDLDGSTRSKTVDSPKVDPTFLKVSKELRDHKGSVVVDPNYDFDITVSSDNYSKVFNLKAGESITSTSLRHFGQYSFSEVDDRYTVTSEVSNMLIANERLDVSIKVINQEKSGPDIVSDKTVDDNNGNGYAERGETLHYSIYVDNDSDAPARLLEVKDSLDLLLPYIVDPRNNVVDLLNDGVSTTTTVGQLMDGLSIYVAAKGSVRLDFNLTLLDNLDVDLVTKLKNVAIVGDTTPEVTIDTTRPKFIASKSVMDANTNSIAEPNETLTYTIRVENNGLIDTGELVIQDTLDDLLPSILDPSANVLTFLLEGDIFTDTVASLMAGDISYNLEPGQVLTLSFDVTLKAEVTDTELTNIASVGPLKPDAKIPVGKPKVSAEKLVSDHNQDGVAEPGEILYYTLKIQNTGNVAALGVTIQDDLADIIDYIVSPNLINAKVKIGMEETSISLDDLREGIVRNIMPFTEIEITFQVGLIQDLDVNTVTVLKNRLIVDDIPYEAEIPTGAPKLVISKTVMDANDNGFAELGENLVYTIEVENTGNHIAKDIFIQDNFLTMIDYIDPPIDELSNDIDGRTLNELMEGFLIDIEAGAKIILTFQVTVKSDLDMEKVKMISNLATVFTETPEVEIPTGKAIINASKEVIDENNNQFAEPGEKLTYTISVSNTGQVEVKDLLVQDKMEELFDYLDDAKASGVKVMVGVDESTKTITQLREGFLIDLDADQSATITFDFYLVDDLDVDEITILKNIALVGSDTPEVEIPTGDSKLASEKTVSDANENGFAEPGEVITYTIHIGNSGKVLAEGVIVKDDLADLVDYVQDTTVMV